MILTKNMILGFCWKTWFAILERKCKLSIKLKILNCYIYWTAIKSIWFGGYNGFQSNWIFLLFESNMLVLTNGYQAYLTSLPKRGDATFEAQQLWSKQIMKSVELFAIYIYIFFKNWCLVNMFKRTIKHKFNIKVGKNIF